MPLNAQEVKAAINNIDAAIGDVVLDILKSSNNDNVGWIDISREEAYCEDLRKNLKGFEVTGIDLDKNGNEVRNLFEDYVELLKRSLKIIAMSRTIIHFSINKQV